MNVIQIAVADAHPFKGSEHCPACRALFFSRSNEKWNNLLSRWAEVRKRMEQTYKISPEIEAAIMTKEVIKQ